MWRIAECVSAVKVLGFFAVVLVVVLALVVLALTGSVTFAFVGVTVAAVTVASTGMLGCPSRAASLKPGQ